MDLEAKETGGVFELVGDAALYGRAMNLPEGVAVRVFEARDALKEAFRIAVSTQDVGR